MKNKITETEFLGMVIKLAKLRGWLVHHQRPGLNRRGKWSSAMQGDVGFPDLVLVRGNRIIFAELKVGKNKPTDAQEKWLKAIFDTATSVFLWTFDDWDFIERILK